MTKNEGKKAMIARGANESAVADLTLACQDNVSFGIVAKSVTEELPEGDASLAWESLKERYYQQDLSAALVSLKTQYNKCKLTSVEENPDDWVTKLEKLVERLNKMGLKISDHDLKIHIFNNLPSAYDATVEIIEGDVNNYTIQKIRFKLNDMLQKILRGGIKSESAPDGIKSALFLSTFK